jgi:hypothetical protein
MLWRKLTTALADRAFLEQAKLSVATPAADDQFGWSVALSGDGNTALAGVPGRESAGGSSNSGAVRIFIRSDSTWTQQASPFPSDLGVNDQFGISVALSSDGNTALMGSFLEDPSGVVDAGSAYVFTRSGSTWTQQAKLVASDAQAGDRFGWPVVLSSDGNTALITAYREDPSGLADAGAAYVFTRSGSTWTQQAKLVASDAQAGDEFGRSAALSGDGNTALIGAHFEDPSGLADAGAAYVFTRSGSTWTQQAKLVASDAQAGDRFGWSVALSGDGNTALIGAFTEDPGGISDAGSVYVFTRSGSIWSERAKLTASDAAAGDQFGWSVALSGDGNTALIGANLEDPGGISDAGSVYVFAR